MEYIERVLHIDVDIFLYSYTNTLTSKGGYSVFILITPTLSTQVQWMVTVAAPWASILWMLVLPPPGPHPIGHAVGVIINFDCKLNHTKGTHHTVLQCLHCLFVCWLAQQSMIMVVMLQCPYTKLVQDVNMISPLANQCSEWQVRRNVGSRIFFCVLVMVSWNIYWIQFKIVAFRF